MAIVNQLNLEFKQMKVKMTFLNVELEETIYMEQQKSFAYDKSKVCLLKKYSYRIKNISNK